MKPIAALIGLGIFIMMLGAIMLALVTFRGADFTEPHNVVSGNTTALIVLANPVLDDSTTNIGVVSTQATDAPVPYLYVAINRQLTINGLDDTVSRTLTITYKVPRGDTFSDILGKYFPAFLVLAGLCIAVGAAISAFRR